MKKVLTKKVNTKKRILRSKKSFTYIFAALLITFGICSSVIYAQSLIKNKPLEKVTDAYILTRLGKLTVIPNQDPLYIAKIKDEDMIKRDMNLYTEAKKGDYIVVFREKAFIFDLNNNKLIRAIDWNDE